MADANKVEAEKIAAEKKKFGFNRGESESDADSENVDEEESENLDDEEGEEVDGDADDSAGEGEEEDESDDSDDDSDDSDKDDDDEAEDEEDDSSSKSKKQIPFKAHNALRKELGKVKKLLTAALNKNVELEKKLPDDFQERVDALVKELGVEDPATLTKIIKFVKEAAVDKNVASLEKKISDLEQIVRDNKVSTVVDEFPTEWKAFEEDQFIKAFPNATAEQKKTAREIMRNLANGRKTGGKVYIHPKSQKEVLDPYPLDYLFYKYRDRFEEVVTGKKSKGMERARGGKIVSSREEADADNLHVPKNASAATIREKDKKYRELESGATDRFNAPTGSI